MKNMRQLFRNGDHETNRTIRAHVTHICKGAVAVIRTVFNGTKGGKYD